MAELADALDSGSSESNFMKVQVLLPAEKTDRPRSVFCFVERRGKGLEASVVNDSPGDCQSASRPEPQRGQVLLPAEKTERTRSVFCFGEVGEKDLKRAE